MINMTNKAVTNILQQVKFTFYLLLKMYVLDSCITISSISIFIMKTTRSIDIDRDSRYCKCSMSCKHYELQFIVMEQCNTVVGKLHVWLS